MQNKLQAFRAGASSVLLARDAEKLLRYNEDTLQYGLVLTKQQAMELIDTKNTELRYNGRLEFGEGIIGKLIAAFAPSPYIAPQNYAQTLHTLIEIFYYYKNETDEKLSDDELIEYMCTFFNGSCEGSTELLASRELDSLARALRSR